MDGLEAKVAERNALMDELRKLDAERTEHESQIQAHAEAIERMMPLGREIALALKKADEEIHTLIGLKPLREQQNDESEEN